MKNPGKMINMISSLVEYHYAQKIYPVLASKISQVTGVLPFSLAELIVVGGFLLLVYKLTRWAARLLTNPISFLEIVNLLGKTFIAIVGLSALFLGLWGLNYHRLPLSQIVGMEVAPANGAELEGLCAYLIEKANELRTLVEEDSFGFMKIPSPADVLGRANLGYDRAARDYPQLKGVYGQPKPVVLSKAMSYLGIWGVYFPYTAEANVNIAIPASQLPSTACHEMAHQRGFAREDEANYLAYLVCQYHPDPDFQYSGSLLALIHSMNALQAEDPQAAGKLKANYSPGVKRDLIELSRFSSKHRGWLQEFSTKVNNYYLKANNQKEGVKSYGRMVDLLLAEYKKRLSAEIK